jgi:fructokinase
VSSHLPGDDLLARKDGCRVITVIGQAMVRLVPAPDCNLMQALPGGTALSTALHAARLGYPTALMARLSSDPLGQMLRRHAAMHGLDLSASPEADEPTMIAVASAGADADSTTSLYFRDTASWQWSAAELRWIPADTTILHLDLLACCVPPGATRVLRAAARERSRGTIVCLNARAEPAVMGSPARGRLLLDRPIRTADVLTTTVEDISWLYPRRGAEAIARLWLANGPELVVISRGRDGLAAVRKSGMVLHRATRLGFRSVTGFDAAFTGALLCGLHQLSNSGVSINTLSTGELGSVLDTAIAAACRSDADCLHPLTARGPRPVKIARLV